MRRRLLRRCISHCSTYNGLRYDVLWPNPVASGAVWSNRSRKTEAESDLKCQLSAVKSVLIEGVYSLIATKRPQNGRYKLHFKVVLINPGAVDTPIMKGPLVDMIDRNSAQGLMTLHKQPHWLPKVFPWR